jgi:hypothetical protein
MNALEVPGTGRMVGESAFRTNPELNPYCPILQTNPPFKKPYQQLLSVSW